MMKYKHFLVGIAVLGSTAVMAQVKYEREFRIKQDQFPNNAISLIKEEIHGVKRLRFYKEIDSLTVSFEAKFKKDKLKYSVEFDTDGGLQDIEILIEEVDIPSDAFESMTSYLKSSYDKFKIRKIQQQYPLKEGKKVNEVIYEAFQNLLLPYINYEMIVSCKTTSGREQYEILFDSKGAFLSSRKSLPANYDHVLY